MNHLSAKFHSIIVSNTLTIFMHSMFIRKMFVFELFVITDETTFTLAVDH